MKQLTLTNLIENSNIPATLIRSTVKQFGGWDCFKESAQDVTNHGIDGGFGGFIYHVDTIDFTRRNKKAILEMAEEQAEDFGQGMFEMIMGLNCMKGFGRDEIAESIHTGEGDDVTTVFNCLAWYAGEEVCHAYSDLIEG